MPHAWKIETGILATGVGRTGGGAIRVIGQWSSTQAARRTGNDSPNKRIGVLLGGVAVDGAEGVGAMAWSLRGVMQVVFADGNAYHDVMELVRR